MYLLMLLATFISAIYGYNLSARPDYDRDVVKKKAMGIVYRFMFQEKTVGELVARIGSGQYGGTGYGLNFLLPEDLIYADFNVAKNQGENFKDTTLYLKQPRLGNAVNVFYMRKPTLHNDDAQTGSFQMQLADNYLETGRHFYNGDMMVSKAICLDVPLHLADASTHYCTPQYNDPEDTGSGVVATCCNKGYNYLVTYRKLDSRWINRVTQGVSLDFMNAIVNRQYSDNLGIIHWDGHHWQFQGKISFTEVYAAEKEAYEAEHANDEGESRYFPVERMQKSTWELPEFFKQDFFKDKDGRNLCGTAGCLFRIRNF